MLSSTHLMITLRLEDNLPRLATSFCIYQSSYCKASYIGRCLRNLYFRAREHPPLWLSRGIVRTINSSILTHLVQTGYTANMEQSFTTVYLVNSNLPKSIRLEILQIAEAIAIRIKEPGLCVQKNYI